MNKVTVALRLRSRGSTKSKVLPVSLRITYRRIPSYFNLGISLSPDDFRKLSSARIGEQLLSIKRNLEKQYIQAKEIISRIEPFSVLEFRRQFIDMQNLSKDRSKAESIICLENLDLETGHINRSLKSFKTDNGDISTENDIIINYKYNRRKSIRKYPRIRSHFDFESLGGLAQIFGDYIKTLDEEKRIGTAEMYFASLLSLLAFQSGLKITDVTKSFLLKYEDWMIKKGNSYTTIGMYLRNLRALFNRCVEDGIIGQNMYPFGRRRYQIPSGKNIKKAMDLRHIKQLYDYMPITGNPNEGRARDMWFFLFFGNGMNPKDLAFLKYKNIHGEYIRFVRQKTKNATRTDPPTISIYYNEDMRGIVSKWGNPDKRPQNYIFPILEPECSAQRERESVQSFIKMINKWMAFIVIKGNIPVKIRCMEARHSYSTILKRAGASPDYIRESLGHTSLKTTQSYLDGFEDENKKEQSLKLLCFKTFNGI